MWRFEALCKVPILFSLTDAQLYELARCMKYQTLQANQLVFKKGDPGELELHCLQLHKGQTSYAALQSWEEQLRACVSEAVYMLLVMSKVVDMVVVVN